MMQDVEIKTRTRWNASCVYRLDLGILLSGKSPEYKQPDSIEAVTQQTAELTKETADFMAQFQKQATETIKSVVGVSK